LAGIWEGDRGEDVAYSNEKGSVGLTPYREHTEFKPFVHGKLAEHLSHTDSNILYRIGDA
jgi:hypothetical protein